MRAYLYQLSHVPQISLQRGIGYRNRTCLATLAIVTLLTVSTTRGSNPGPSAGNAVHPGESFVVEFPNLRNDRRDEVAKMQVRIPENYTPNQRVPLFIWLGGGAGTHKYSAAARIADPERYVLIGLPYPLGANDRYQKTMVGNFRRIWAYHSTMLKELFERVPNIDPNDVSIAGFSNGAHCIDGYLKLREPSEFFRAFVIAEGGGYRGSKYDTAIIGKPVLVLWGDASPHRKVAPGLAARLRMARMNVTTIKMKSTKHAFPPSYQAEARKWFLDEE